MTSPALVTGQSVLMGTAAYMAPEQARGKPADKRADIWAFGVVLYEMLTGSRAFVGDTVTEVAGAVIHKELDLSALPHWHARRRASAASSLPSKGPDDNGFATWVTCDCCLTVHSMRQYRMPRAETIAQVDRDSSRSHRVGALVAASLAAGACLDYHAPSPYRAISHSRQCACACTGSFERVAFALSPDGRHLAFVASTKNRGSDGKAGSGCTHSKMGSRASLHRRTMSHSPRSGHPIASLSHSCQTAS